MSAATIEATQVNAKAGSTKYLTFLLGGESYGIAVLKIREIIRLQPATAVPQMPPYVKGVINLRGKIIPVIDLRIKFGMAGIEDNEQTCIVVVQVELAKRGSAYMGLVVDGVEEVVSLSAEDIEEAPDFGTRLETDYIQGMAKVKGVVKTLIDIDRVVSAEALEHMAEEASAEG